jgi:hypothetical protein
MGDRRAVLSGQIVKDGAVWPIVTVAAMDQLRQGGAHRLKLRDLAVDLLQVPFCNLLDL